MVKAQVQLEKEDLEQLRALAAREGVSVSELVRRSVRTMLETQAKPSRRELLEEALSVAGIGHSGRHDIGWRHDDYLAETLGE